nr:helix-turn-helix domain-containing protein [Muribaculaceae bacterium]
EKRAAHGSVTKGRKEKKEKKPRRPVGYSKRLSFDMFMRGKSVSEIAAERELAASTIASHLAEFVASGELAIEKVIPPERIALLEPAFSGGASITEVSEMLAGKVKPYEVSLYYRSSVGPLRAMPPAERKDS